MNKQKETHYYGYLIMEGGYKLEFDEVDENSFVAHCDADLEYIASIDNVGVIMVENQVIRASKVHGIKVDTYEQEN